MLVVAVFALQLTVHLSCKRLTVYMYLHATLLKPRTHLKTCINHAFGLDLCAWLDVHLNYNLHLPPTILPYHVITLHEVVVWCDEMVYITTNPPTFTFLFHHVNLPTLCLLVSSCKSMLNDVPSMDYTILAWNSL